MTEQKKTTLKASALPFDPSGKKTETLSKITPSENKSDNLLDTPLSVFLDQDKFLDKILDLLHDRKITIPEFKIWDCFQRSCSDLYKKKDEKPLFEKIIEK